MGRDSLTESKEGHRLSVYIAHTRDKEIQDYAIRLVKQKKIATAVETSVPIGVEPNRDNITAAFHRLKGCDVIQMPPGWERNELARIEHSIAVHFKLGILYP